MSKPTVLLDPGHGGYDPGAVANGLREKEINLLLALKTAERLKGVKVLLTRERDTYVSLADRVALSRRAEPDLFLSLHANAGGGRGFESFVYSGLGAGAPALALQRAVHAEIMAVLAGRQIVNRGMKKAAFYVLKHNPRPAVLIESLFIDNAREAAIWKEPRFANTLAGAVAEGIYRYLGLPRGGGTAGSVPGEAGGGGGVAGPDPGGNGSGGTGSSETGSGETKPGVIPGITEGGQDGGRAGATPGRTGPSGQGGTGEQAAPSIIPVNLAGRKLYTVQVGAFLFIENARQRLAEAQQAGFSDAYISQKQF